MHYQRLATLLASETQGNSGTKYVDIDVADPITELVVRITGTNHSGAVNANVNPFRNITRLSIIDGADVLWSMPGVMAAALYAFTYGKLPPHLIDEAVSQSQQAYLPIRFGRFLGDEEWSFDPKQFTNPQLKIEHNLAVPNAVGSGGYLTATATLAAWARVMEGAPAPSAFIMAKDIETHAGGGSGYKTSDLPTDYPHRNLLIHAWKTKTLNVSVVSSIKLSKNVDKVVYYDHSTWYLARLMELWYEQVHLFRQLSLVDTDTRESYFGVYAKGTIVSEAAAYIHTVDSWDAGSLTHHVTLASSGAAESTARNAACNQWGYQPFSHLCLPLGNPGDPSDFLAFLPDDKVKLRLGDGSSTSTITVACEQLRGY